VAHGFLPALMVGFGSLIGDATWATIALVGLAVLAQNAVLQVVLALTGAGLLFYLARSALLDAHLAAAHPERHSFALDLGWGLLAVAGLLLLIQGWPAFLAGFPSALRWPTGLALALLGWWQIAGANPFALPKPRPASAGGDFATGAALSLGNPWNIVFWLGIGSQQLALLDQPQLADYLTFFAGFMTGALLWCFVVAGLVAWGRQFVTPSFFRRVNLVCGLLLGVFALQLLRQLLGE
jgi:chemosensory pili system protein ChpE